MKPKYKSRRENLILDPMLDRLKEITEYSEVSIFKIGEYDSKLIISRGSIPQSEALSVSTASLKIDKAKIQIFENFQRMVFQDDGKGSGKRYYLQTEDRQKSGVFIPIHKKKKVIAGAYLFHLKADYFTPELVGKIQDYFQAEITSLEAGMMLAEAIERNAEADYLFEAQKSLNECMDQAKILDLVVKKARELVFAHNAFIFLSQGNEYVLSAMDQVLFDDVHIGDIFCFTELFMGYPRRRVVRTGPAQSPREDAFTKLMKSSDSLAVEIVSQDQALGFLLVNDKKLIDFGKADFRVLSMLAAMTGPVLQNSILYNCARNMAALEERDRLSRELHDDLAQRMAYFKIETDMIRRYMDEGKKKSAEDHLALLDRAVDETYNTLREIIFNLREELQPNEGFLDSLTRYLVEYRRRYGLDVKLTNRAKRLPGFSLDEVAQIARIIQEGLMNVRKHAGTNRAEILLREQKESFTLQIKDEGKGFRAGDVEEDAQAHYGARIMRERAESIGGALKIKSVPGQGTTLTLSLPIERERK
jgi:nitrate/nitrite-specific signal transduction histidine kinase